MKINENLCITYRMMIFFSHQFSPKGQAGDFHMLRYLPAVQDFGRRVKDSPSRQGGMAWPLSAPDDGISLCSTCRP